MCACFLNYLTVYAIRGGFRASMQEKYFALIGFWGKHLDTILNDSMWVVKKCTVHCGKCGKTDAQKCQNETRSLSCTLLFLWWINYLLLKYVIWNWMHEGISLGKTVITDNKTANRLRKKETQHMSLAWKSQRDMSGLHRICAAVDTLESWPSAVSIILQDSLIFKSLSTSHDHIQAVCSAITIH